MKKENQAFYYKQNLAVLKFDDIKDVLYIQFDHYIKRKENLQRMNKELPVGQFYLTTREVGEHYGIHPMKAKRLIDKFVKLDIIRPVAISDTKGIPSAYAYKSVTNDVTNGYTDSVKTVTNKSNKINTSNNTSATNGKKSVTNDVTNSDTYKIDNNKKIIKKDINNIYCHSENDITHIRGHYPGTKNKLAADKKLPKLIQKYGKEQLIRSIQRYSEYVKNERANGFEGLMYKNESTWWNSGYVDYLDENYQDIKTNDKPMEDDENERVLRRPTEEQLRKWEQEYDDIDF